MRWSSIVSQARVVLCAFGVTVGVVAFTVSRLISVPSWASWSVPVAASRPPTILIAEKRVTTLE